MIGVEENAYDILGLEQGPTATEADIKKAYRKLALIKHPDKNPDNPKAADEFAVLQSAYDLLLDTDARAALDAFLKVRAVRVERTVIHDEKRRRMAEELSRKEKLAETGSELDSAKARLLAEIERMRTAAKDRAKAQRDSTTATARKTRVPATAASPGPKPQAGASDLADALPRSLKVSWTLDAAAYTAATLRQIFSNFGSVEEVVMREGKKKKGSAIVVMKTQEGAQKAAASADKEVLKNLTVIAVGEVVAHATTDARQTAAPLAESGYINEHHEPSTTNAEKPKRFLSNSRPIHPLFPAAKHVQPKERASEFATFASYRKD